MLSRKIGAIIAGIIVFGALVGGISCTEKINAGYVGVVYSMNGGIKDDVLTQGWHIVPPTQKVTEYSIATEQICLSASKTEGSPNDDSFGIPTNDGKSINVDMEYSYHFDSEKLPVTFSKFRGQDGDAIQMGFINSKMKSWSQEVSANYSVLDIYGSKRAELNRAVYEHVKKNFEEYGIVIDSVNFSRIGLDEQTAGAIQAIVNAQQELKKVEIDKQKAQLEAERSVIEAEGKAKVTAINAQAQSDANAKMQATLTDNLVQLEAIKKWDGKLPTVTGGSTPMVNISATTATATGK